MNYPALRTTLKCGSLVFGASALFLLIAPSLFLTLLSLDSTKPLIWAMRMIAITLLALSGNMWNNAVHNSDAAIGNVAKVMCVSATALGVLTL